MTNPVLETKSLTRRFGAPTAVDARTLSVNGGEVFGLLGPNGAGKTTATKMLTTLLTPAFGEAWVDGFSIATATLSVRRAIGNAPQRVSVDGAPTGNESPMIFAKLDDLLRGERQARIAEAWEFMSLTAEIGHLVGQGWRPNTGSLARPDGIPPPR